MRFCLIHLDDVPRPGEEATVLVRGEAPTAILVPVDALPDFLPILDRATLGARPELCSGCGEQLPGSRPAPDAAD